MIGRPRLLSNLAYVKLWLATSVTQLGTQVSFLAIPLIAVQVLKASPLAVSALNTLEYLPFAIVGLPAGVWVDRLRRRPIMVVSDLARAAILLSIPGAYLQGWLSIWQLYAVVLATGVFSVFFDVAYQSYLPALVEREELVGANAGLEVSRSGAQVVGPGLAGALIAWLTAPLAIVADSLSFLASAGLLGAMRAEEGAAAGRRDAAAAPPFAAQVRAGLAYVWRHRLLRPIVLFTSLVNLGWAIVEGIFVVYAVRTLGLSAGSLGLVFSIANAGLLAGLSLSSLAVRRFGLGWALVLSGLVEVFGVALLPLAPVRAPLPFLAAGMFLRTFALIIYNVNQVSLRQAITPEQMLGRMNATVRFISWSTIPLGSLLGGVLATWAGLRPATMIGAAVGVLGLVPLAFSPLRAQRSMPERGA